jgi:hypothetical protein
LKLTLKLVFALLIEKRNERCLIGCCLMESDAMTRLSLIWQPLLSWWATSGKKKKESIPAYKVFCSDTQNTAGVGHSWDVWTITDF